MKICLPPKKHIASFDVDAQNTFTPLCPEELPVPEGHLIVAELNKQAKWASVRVGSKDAHSPRALWLADEKHPPFSPMHEENIDMRWPLHAVPGTKGFQLISGLPHPKDYDYFVWKGIEIDMHPYGACYHDLKEKLSTGVIEFLQQRAIQTVIIGGLAFDYCVKATALQLKRADFDVIINRAACRGINPESISVTEKIFREASIKIINCADELNELTKK